MSNFGKILRQYRNRSSDPLGTARRLTQERLGELLGNELGSGFSGAAISDWERGVSKINADQRPVLLSLVKVLYEQGCIKTVSEANELLESGNYRSLNSHEKQQIFHEDGIESTDLPDSSKAHLQTFLFSFLNKKWLYPFTSPDLQIAIEQTEQGPAPAWPRKVVVIMKMIAKGIKLNGVKFILWMWALFLVWFSVLPSLRFPFPDRQGAATAIVLYAGATLVIPAIVGALTSTKDVDFWQLRGLALAIETRLYTYQGASLGFHIGYFAILFVRLLMFYFGLKFVVWIELLAIGVTLLCSYLGARLVPYNLYHAFGRLNLKDGAIFFAFMLLGPIWGFLFFEAYTTLFAPVVGFLSFFLALTFCVVVASRRRH